MAASPLFTTYENRATRIPHGMVKPQFTTYAFGDVKLIVQEAPTSGQFRIILGPSSRTSHNRKETRMKIMTTSAASGRKMTRG